MLIKKTGMLSHNALAFSIIGGVLVGALGAVFAFAPLRFPSSANNAQAQPGKTSLSGSSQQEAATATQQALATTPPTATAVAPTATVPRPTPTNTPAPTLRGTVMSVDTNNNQFVVRQFNGTLTTVIVTGKTTYQGRAGTLSILQVTWRVQVTGVFQGDGTFKASNVNYDD
ncbi:MAG TPA: DUF5666 domain-containing protein [Ktedonobacterales bacterium]|jgi:cytoskeletal protein RodZ